jgi:hypothetical protein
MPELAITGCEIDVPDDAEVRVNNITRGMVAIHVTGNRCAVTLIVSEELLAQLINRAHAALVRARQVAS